MRHATCNVPHSSVLMVIRLRHERPSQLFSFIIFWPGGGVKSGKYSSHATFAMVFQLFQFGKVIAAAAEEEREGNGERERAVF